MFLPFSWFRNIWWFQKILKNCNDTQGIVWHFLLSSTTPLSERRGYDVDKDKGRPCCNMRTRSRGWQQGLVLTCWQVRGWAADCYHWLWFHTHSPLNCFVGFFRCARVCLRGEIGIGAGDASEGQRELTKVLWPHWKLKRVRKTTPHTEVGSVQGGSVSVREMRG